MTADTTSRQRRQRGALALGIALGGFFDGILLHQILQWHHLLSGIQVGVLGDLRWQILADGIFHAAMYGVALVGLYWLVSARAAWAGTTARQTLLSGLLSGFGAWHVVDAVVSHWLTGLHRVRMDVANPLPWDIGWLLAFGIVPIMLGWWWKRRPPGGSSRVTASVGVLVLAVTTTGALFNLYPIRADASVITVLMRPDRTLTDLMPAMADADARLLWSDRAGGVWVLRTAQPTSAATWYRHGAMWVSGGAGVSSCADWLRPGA